MSIITEALKKAQTERVPAPPSDAPGNIRGAYAPPGPGQNSPLFRGLNRPIMYTAGSAFLIITIVLACSAVFLGSISRGKPQGGMTSISSGSTPQLPVKANPAPGPAVKIEPFSITIPRIASPPHAPARQTPDLSGIMYLPTSPQAVINGRTVKEGDVVDGYTVIRINPESVKLSSDGAETELKLR